MFNYPLELVDALGRKLTLTHAPTRIVSLCPSQTETLAYFAPQRLVGITRYCIHPETIQHLPKVGGTKKVELELIKSLAPDFILAEKEENTPEIVESLASFCPVYVTNIESVVEAIEMIHFIGQLLDVPTQAQELVGKIQHNFELLKNKAQDYHKNSTLPKVGYFIWRKPYMVAGINTYINDVLQYLGFENIFAHLPNRYPTLVADEMRHYEPDIILLSSEPYPFQAKHISELQSIWTNARIELVDGEAFSWYGSRMNIGASYLAGLQAQFLVA